MGILFGKKADGVNTRKVVAVLFDPLGLNPPVENLMQGYMHDIREASAQQLSYEIVSSLKLNVFPPLIGGQRYTKSDYQAAITDQHNAYQIVPGQFLMADYEVMLNDFGIINGLRENKSDEIWLWGGGYFGFWESILGGWSAFPCNSPSVIPRTCLLRRFAVMGFNYEREVGEMLEAFGHRVEVTLARKFRSDEFLASLYDHRRIHQEVLKPRNDFEKFLLSHGTIHRSPNAPKTPPGENDYWWEPLDIRTHHRDWLINMKRDWWKCIV